jgi:hypothetical protein
MFELFHSRTLNARQFCTQMYYAGQAGIDAVRKYGLAPGKHSGHYQRHIDHALGGSKVLEMYELMLPIHGKHSLSRSLFVLRLLVPHELIAETMSEPSFRTRLREVIENGDLPPVYHNHPVVLEWGRRHTLVAPYALYVDGVPYSVTDTVIGYWLVCLTTAKRYLFSIVRKHMLCECGCRGWCSHYQLHLYVHWTLLALARGEHPSQRHDGAPWRKSDCERMLLTGCKLPFPGCLVHVKGDWSEFAGTFGLPMWNDALRPCYECAACGSSMYTSFGHTCRALNFPCNADADYEAACVRCEVHVRLSDDAMRTSLVNALRPDKRKAGIRGLGLVTPFPALTLQVDDRLEPSPTLPDVHALQDAVLPIDIVFWRSSNDTLTRHRNPIFCAELGTSVHRTLTIDELHANNLGVMKTFCKHVLWYILLSGVYGALGTNEENLASAVLAFRHELMQWYKQHAVWNLTRLSNFKIKMIGSSGEKKCKTKGAETYGLMLFLIHLLDRNGHSLGERGARYLAAGIALRRVTEIWKENGNLIPESAQQETWNIKWVVL